MTPDILNNILRAEEMLQTSNFTHIFSSCALRPLKALYIEENTLQSFSWREAAGNWAHMELCLLLTVFQK